MLMVGVYGLTVAHGHALFVVLGVLYKYRLRILSLVMEVLGADPGVSGGALV